MKYAAITLLVAPLLAVPASAQSVTFRIGPPPPPPAWSKDAYPYARTNHQACYRKAWELREYERHASADRNVSPRERRTIASLQRDLDRTCGRYRWRG